MTPAYALSDTSLTVFIPGERPLSTTSANPSWDLILDAIRDGDWESVADLATPRRAVARYLDAQLDIKLEDDILYYKGEALHNSLTDRILKMIGEDMPITPLVNFLVNLMSNPSSRAIDELYSFLEYGNLPITPDGHFLAYKRVNDDYKDMYTGSVDNSLGCVVEMARHKVNDDSRQTCSHGLHFASLEYLKHFHGNRLMALKINPRDVVSIPYDYNNSKGRCCRYRVVDELDPKFVYEDAWNTSVVQDYDPVEDDFELEIEDDGPEEEERTFWPLWKH